MSTRTHFGATALDNLRTELENRNIRRVLVITPPRRRFIEALSTALSGFDIEVFDHAEVHVPASVVAAAHTFADTINPGALISLGGGSATGLAKALRLELQVPFYCIPTTYSGSEMTAIYGITTDGEKTTSRNEQVRPEAVYYVPEFSQHLPLDIKIKSLLNALAHPVSALSTGRINENESQIALDLISRLIGTALQLAESPRLDRAQLEAIRAASDAGALLDRSELGHHHRIVHALGGQFALEHAALHALVLPHSLRRLSHQQPDIYARIEAAAGIPDVPGQLFDLLLRVGAPTSLRGLDVKYANWTETSISEDVLDAELRSDIFHGRPPSLRIRREDWGLREKLSLIGSPLESARTVVIGVHGRGQSADGILIRAQESFGHSTDWTYVAPQSPNLAWYASSYRSRPESIGPSLDTAVQEIQTVIAKVRAAAPQAQCILFSFSQGACVAIQCVTLGTSVDVLIAFSGAHIGGTPELAATHPPSQHLEGMPVLLGISEQDVWVDAHHVRATGQWFEAQGALVEMMFEAGDIHQISGRQRIRAYTLTAQPEQLTTPRGFGNTHECERLNHALPPRLNSPRRVRYGLYAEQVNATGFAAERSHNHRSWMYRIRPSAQHTPFNSLPSRHLDTHFGPPHPQLVGYRPLNIPESPQDFVEGLMTFGGAGHPQLRRGFALHLYTCNRSMEHRALANCDGDFLIIPQIGRILLLTELGFLNIAPGQIALIPRGLRFSVLLQDSRARGYAAEVYGRQFELPERGPVGANGLTESRHFQGPTPWYEDRQRRGYRIVHKLGGSLFEARQDYSPYDVVAWHGNYAPYSYNLLDFSPVANVRFDHPDPSIYTVLSAPMDEQGAHTLDFVFFPPRWDITEGTFRPPFFHRNATTEFNGIIQDPKGDEAPFYAGGYFLTPAMTPHGVLAQAVQRTFLEDKDPPPHRTSERSMWFQFESTLPIGLTAWALDSDNRIAEWAEMWGTYRTHFEPYSVEQP